MMESVTTAAVREQFLVSLGCDEIEDSVSVEVGLQQFEGWWLGEAWILTESGVVRTEGGLRERGGWEGGREQQ